MAQSSVTDSTHPVLVAAAQVEAALKAVRDVEPAFMRVEEKQLALTSLPRLRDQIDALLLGIIEVADDVAEEAGCRDVAAWLAPNALMDRPAAGAAQRLARSLGRRWRVVAEGLREGAVSSAQAGVICRCLDALVDAPVPDGEQPLDPELVAKAEAELVRLAERHTPAELRRLGERIVSLVAPHLDDERDRKALEDAERRAAAATRLSMRARGDGSTDLSARIPDAVAARLKTYLDAYTSPRTDAAPQIPVVDPATGLRLPHRRLLGEAFCALVEAIPADAMPLHGGSATTLVVTVDLDTLRTGLGVATTGDGTPISAGEARRMACRASIIPMVLGAKSQPLDLGRSKRLFSKAQRLALAASHPTCRAEGCTVPSTWCEAHHWRQPWAKGGRTDVADGQLLCSWHHHRAHDDRYDTRQLASGDVRFHRRR
jgi:hypothetical protein